MKLLQKILPIFILLVFALPAFSQVNETGGPIIGIETYKKCHTALDGTTTNFLDIKIIEVGLDSMQNFGTFLVDNTDFVVPLTGDVQFGYCNNNNAYNYEWRLMCDDGTTPFYRILQIVTTDTSRTASTFMNVDTAGVQYTPLGTIGVGSCSAVSVTAVVDNIVRQETTGIGNITGTNGFMSYSICNTGVRNGVLTVGGGAPAPLRVGQCHKCNVTYDPSTQRWLLCPDLTWDATNTRYTVSSWDNN